MAVAPYLVSSEVTQATQKLRIVANEGDSVGPLTIDIPGLTGGIVTMDAPASGPNVYAYEFQPVPPGTYSATIYDASPAKLPSFTVSFTVNQQGPITYGCTTPRALNYDPRATRDTAPTACEFVQTFQLPGLAAAHLPLPVAVRSSPTATGLATIVVLVLETADALAGPWQEFGRLKRVCDDTATAVFDLSEAAKSLLRIRPPVESGVDPSLSALLQVRYIIYDPETLTPLSTGTVGQLRVLNAVVAPVSGALLTTLTPYATQPQGAALWATRATLAGGVVATPAPLPTDGCQPRQFVWLNAAGAWDSGFFYGRHGHGTDQADSISYRDVSGADRYARRGVVRATLQVYSDKLDWPTYQAVRGVRDAVQVYERVGLGRYVPVLLPTESYQEYQEVTDKTFNVNFNLSYPAQLIQTQ